MTVELRHMTREAADAILAGERPGDVRVADDYPTEFSAGVARSVGTVAFGPFFVHRSKDDVVVGEIGGAFVDENGTIEIGYAVVESQYNRGYATAAVEALVTRAREASAVRRIVAHTPLDRERRVHPEGECARSPQLRRRALRPRVRRAWGRTSISCSHRTRDGRSVALSPSHSRATSASDVGIDSSFACKARP